MQNTDTKLLEIEEIKAVAIETQNSPLKNYQIFFLAMKIMTAFYQHLDEKIHSFLLQVSKIPNLKDADNSIFVIGLFG